MNAIKLVRYEAGSRRQWNDFVAEARNGHFLFHRDYMDYHADRFPDASLMFLGEADELLAIMPATRSEEIVSSHNGLSFAGVVSGKDMKVGLMLELFDCLLAHLHSEGVEKLIYKAVPHIYHRMPAEEDLYALFRNQARLYRRDVASTLDMNARLPFSKGRRWAIKQAEKAGVTVGRSFEFAGFMKIEAQVLDAKYGVRPVHTAEEIELLASRFPENIKLFTAQRNDEMLAGIIIYESSQVAHAQYIGATEAGRACGASDLIMNYLINDYYTTKKYFDFGISTEDNGRYLNSGLIENKQGFGGRAIAYDSYEVHL